MGKDRLRDECFTATTNPELAARATAGLLKIVAFDSQLPTTNSDDLSARLRAFCELAGLIGAPATAQAFTLARFAGREHLPTRDDLLPGPVPPGAVILRLAQPDEFEPEALNAAAVQLGWRDVSVVDEYRPYTARGQRPPSAIVRLGLVRRTAGLSKSDFAEQWVLRHGPLAAGLRPLYDEYVQDVCIGFDRPWDGIVEHWFADEATWCEHDERNRRDKPTVIASARSLSEMQQFAATPVAKGATT
jgi:hypothetical protein